MRKNRVGKWYCVICSVLAVLLMAGCGGNGTQPSQSTAESTATAKESSEAATEGTTAAETQPAQTTAAETLPVQTTAAQSQPDGTPPAALPPQAAGNQPSASGAAQTQGITEADAKQIALSHANVSETDAVYMKVKLEREHGRDEYDVEFYAGNTEYDYEIDAVTGEILSYDYDAESYTPPAAQDQGGNGASAGSQNQSGATYITQEQAKAAAFAHANVSEADVYKLKVEFDQDHGKAEYEVEFEVGHTEYEYEIDGVTGEIISFEVDHD